MLGGILSLNIAINTSAMKKNTYEQVEVENGKLKGQQLIDFIFDHAKELPVKNYNILFTGFSPAKLQESENSKCFSEYQSVYDLELDYQVDDIPVIHHTTDSSPVYNSIDDIPIGYPLDFV